MALSSDGAVVVFASDSPDLVDDDTNGVMDVFVRDTTTGETTRASVTSTGMEADGRSAGAAVSADGSVVAFGSDATNLVEDDTNARSDVFVHDRTSGVTSRISLGIGGAEGDDDSGLVRLLREPYSISISDDGTIVTFTSAATNLVTGDMNGTHDVFRHDRTTGSTTRVSVASDGAEFTGWSGGSSVSGDGAVVAFTTVPGSFDDTEVYVHDTSTGVTTIESRNTSGEVGSGLDAGGLLSADGRYPHLVERVVEPRPGTTRWARRRTSGTSRPE